jgi:hypothetical protein
MLMAAAGALLLAAALALLWPRGEANAVPLKNDAKGWAEELLGKTVTVWPTSQAWGPTTAGKLEFLPQLKGTVSGYKEDWLILTLDGKETWVARPSVFLIQVEK